MKKLNIAIMLGLGLSVTNTAMADDDDVTIRMMDMNETAYENVMKEIELPESASENGREHSAKGLANANARRALNRERQAERERGDDDMDEMDDMDMAKEDKKPENPGDVRVVPERPELPAAANENRAEQSNR